MQPERAEIVPGVCGQWKKKKKSHSGTSQRAEGEERATLQLFSAINLICAALLRVREMIIQFSFSWVPVGAVWISGKGRNCSLWPVLRG